MSISVHLCLIIVGMCLKAYDYFQIFLMLLIHSYTVVCVQYSFRQLLI